MDELLEALIKFLKEAWEGEGIVIRVLLFRTMLPIVKEFDAPNLTLCACSHEG